MQPHSISALAVTNHVFSFFYGEKIPNTAEVEIEFGTPEGKRRSLFHFISQIEPIREGRLQYLVGLQIGVKTTDGSLCIITVRRKTSGPFKQGEEVFATHSVQHRAGLEEHFQLGRSSIQGHHRNSMKYRQFKANVSNESSMTIYCEVKHPEKGHFISIPYRVKVKAK